MPPPPAAGSQQEAQPVGPAEPAAHEGLAEQAQQARRKAPAGVVAGSSEELGAPLLGSDARTAPAKVAQRIERPPHMPSTPSKASAASAAARAGGMGGGAQLGKIAAGL